MIADFWTRPLTFGDLVFYSLGIIVGRVIYEYLKARRSR